MVISHIISYLGLSLELSAPTPAQGQEVSQAPTPSALSKPSSLGDQSPDSPEKPRNAQPQLDKTSPRDQYTRAERRQRAKSLTTCAPARSSGRRGRGGWGTESETGKSSEAILREMKRDRERREAEWQKSLEAERRMRPKAESQEQQWRFIRLDEPSAGARELAKKLIEKTNRINYLPKELQKKLHNPKSRPLNSFDEQRNTSLRKEVAQKIKQFKRRSSFNLSDTFSPYRVEKWLDENPEVRETFYPHGQVREDYHGHEERYRAEVTHLILTEYLRYYSNAVDGILDFSRSPELTLKNSPFVSSPIYGIPELQILESPFRQGTTAKPSEPTEATPQVARILLDAGLEFPEDRRERYEGHYGEVMRLHRGFQHVAGDNPYLPSRSFYLPPLSRLMERKREDEIRKVGVEWVERMGYRTPEGQPLRLEDAFADVLYFEAYRLHEEGKIKVPLFGTSSEAAYGSKPSDVLKSPELKAWVEVCLYEQAAFTGSYAPDGTKINAQNREVHLARLKELSNTLGLDPVHRTRLQNLVRLRAQAEKKYSDLLNPPAELERLKNEYVSRALPPLDPFEKIFLRAVETDKVEVTAEDRREIEIGLQRREQLAKLQLSPASRSKPSGMVTPDQFKKEVALQLAANREGETQALLARIRLTHRVKWNDDYWLGWMSGPEIQWDNLFPQGQVPAAYRGMEALYRAELRLLIAKKYDRYYASSPQSPRDRIPKLSILPGEVPAPPEIKLPPGTSLDPKSLNYDIPAASIGVEVDRIELPKKISLSSELPSDKPQQDWEKQAKVREYLDATPEPVAGYNPKLAALTGDDQQVTWMVMTPAGADTSPIDSAVYASRETFKTFVDENLVAASASFRINLDDKQVQVEQLGGRLKKSPARVLTLVTHGVSNRQVAFSLKSFAEQNPQLEIFRGIPEGKEALLDKPSAKDKNDIVSQCLCATQEAATMMADAHGQRVMVPNSALVEQIRLRQSDPQLEKMLGVVTASCDGVELAAAMIAGQAQTGLKFTLGFSGEVNAKWATQLVVEFTQRVGRGVPLKTALVQAQKAILQQAAQSPRKREEHQQYAWWVVQNTYLFVHKETESSTSSGKDVSNPSPPPRPDGSQR